MFKIENTLENIIKNETPECVLFSGGIDSSAILYESKKYNDNVKGITVGIKENNSEDIRYSSLVSSKLDIDLLVYEVDKEYVLSKVDDAVCLLESFNPEWISSTITLLLGAEYASKAGYKKIGSGEGADDIFGSFPFFKAYEGSRKELNYIMKSRFEKIPVMTDIVSEANNAKGITPFRNKEMVECVERIPLYIRMQETANIKTKFPLRMSYMGIIPHEAIVRPQTMAFTGSGVYSIIKELEKDVSDREFARACEEFFPFKNKLEYVLFKKYVHYYNYSRATNNYCIHCGSSMGNNLVNCPCCQTVQYKKRELKFNA